MVRKLAEGPRAAAGRRSIAAALQRGDRAPPATRWARLIVIAGCVALVAATALITGWQIWRMRQDAIAHARGDAAADSLLLAEQTARSLQAADLILRTTGEFLRIAPAHALADRAAVSALLKDRIADMPQVQGHTVFDAKGFPRYSSRADVPLVSFRDRAFFSVHAQPPGIGLFVSELTPNRANGQPVIYLSRRIAAVDGSFAGVASLGIEPDYFMRVFGNLPYDRMTRVRLMRADGRLLIAAGGTRSPGVPPPPSSDQDGAPSGETWYISRQEVAGYPLTIEVSVAERRALQDWRATAPRLASVAMAGAAMMVVLSTLLYRQLQRVDEGQQELRQSQSLLQTVFDTAPLGIQIKDLQGRLLMVNPALANTVSAAPEELLGRLAHETTTLREIPADERQRILETDAQVLATGEPVEFELERELSVGKRRLRVIKAPLRDSSGAITAFLSVMEDVTDRIRTRRELEESRRLLGTILNTLPQTVTVKDRNGRYTLLNDAWTRLHGLDASQAIGKTAGELTHHPTEEVRWIEALDRKVLETGQAQSLSEIETATRPGRQGWSRIFKAPLPDPTGGVQGILTVTEDISNLKEAEVKRLELERRVLHGQKLESLGVLAGGIAHDFNNLLAGIMGHAELLLHGLAPAHPLRGHVERIIQASGLAGDMTRQMLAYSGKAKMAMRPVNVNDLVQDMGALLRVAIPQPIVLRYELAERLPMIDGDAAQLNQIVMNLIKNAADAIGEEAGNITLATGTVRLDEAQAATVNPAQPPAAGEYVYVQVADTGGGMTPEVQRRIFEPFFTTKFTGRGLGMAAVQGIIHSHNGCITIQTAPGQGTVMRVLLPCSPNQGDAAAPPVPGPLRRPGKGGGPSAPDGRTAS